MSQAIDLITLRRKVLSLLGAVLTTGALFTLVVPLSHWLAEEPESPEPAQVRTVNLPPPEPPPPEPPTVAMQNAAEAVAAAPRPLGAPIKLEALPTNSPAISGVVTGLADVENFPVELSGLNEMPIFEVVDLDRRPQLLQSPPNTKPYELQRANVSGKVLLSVLISPKGHVSVIEVKEADDERLVRYAKRFAEKCVFEPPMHNNQPVTASYLFPLHF